MDESEESEQQQYYIAGSAGRIGNTPPAATANNLCVPVSWPMQPPPPVSATQHQQAQHFDHIRQRLQEVWANQMKEIKQQDFRNRSIPLSPIKRIMKADNDVKLVAKESPVLFAKACEMFILDITSRAWMHTEQDQRTIVQNKDIDEAISKTDIFDFLADTFPRDILKATHEQVGSFAERRIPYYNVPQQDGVGQSGTMLYDDGKQPAQRKKQRTLVSATAAEPAATLASGSTPAEPEAAVYALASGSSVAGPGAK